MLLGPWIRELRRGGFRVHPLQLPLVMSVSLFAVFNSIGRPLQQLIFGRRIARAKMEHAPIFIIGHWRSGTTLLHELMSLDERHTSPTTYECFVPNHFLISAWFVRHLTFLLPRQRPMDNMVVGWDRPQEDEFALCNMGLPSPYLKMLFPNEPEPYAEYLDLEGITPDARKRWQDGLKWFFQRVTARDNRRMVLKSPPHLGRIKALLEVFPDARFVHIVRDPYVVFPSTINLWKAHYLSQSLQFPKFEGQDDYVFRCFERMYRAFDAQRALVDPARFHELRYEDLVRDPAGEMRRLYEQLELGDFENLAPQLIQYLSDTKDYKTNRYELPDELRTQIDERWGPFMRRYGYCQDAAPVGAPAQELPPAK
jgi:hypothetical protein